MRPISRTICPSDGLPKKNIFPSQRLLWKRLLEVPLLWEEKPLPPHTQYNHGMSDQSRKFSVAGPVGSTETLGQSAPFGYWANSRESKGGHDISGRDLVETNPTYKKRGDKLPFFDSSGPAKPIFYAGERRQRPPFPTDRFPTAARWPARARPPRTRYPQRARWGTQYLQWWSPQRRSSRLWDP